MDYRKTTESKRLTVSDNSYRILIYRSNRDLTIQVVGIPSGNVVVFARSSVIKGKTPIERAAKLGVDIAKQITKICHNKKVTFDRNGNLYHGQVKAIADGLRKGGVKI